MDIINWKLSVELAADNEDHAKEFLRLLTRELSLQLDSIRNHVKQGDHHTLKKELHKLLGALSYSGAMRLKQAVADFNEALKKDCDISEVFATFDHEAKIFIEHTKSIIPEEL